MEEAIWTVTPDIAELNVLHENTAVARLGIKMVAVGADFLTGTMPVDERTRQPFGLLHGGASVVLLETLASAAANHCVDQAKYMCVGLEVNCNHLRGVRSGLVLGRAQCVHSGRTSMVWELSNHDERDRLVTRGRLTVAVVERDQRL